MLSRENLMLNFSSSEERGILDFFFLVLKKQD